MWKSRWKTWKSRIFHLIYNDLGDSYKQFDGYMTAWFVYHLQGDTEAGKAFAIGGELSANSLYQDVKEFPLETVGVKFENHERFPKRVNTEFVNVLGGMLVSVRVPPHPCQKSWHYIAGEAYPTQAGHSIGIILSLIHISLLHL